MGAFMKSSDLLQSKTCGNCNGCRLLMSGPTPLALWCFVERRRVPASLPGCSVWLPDTVTKIVAAPLGAHLQGV